MAHIGSIIRPLNFMEMRQRLLVRIDVDCDTLHDAERIWKGGKGFEGLQPAIERYAFAALTTRLRDVVDYATMATPFHHFALWVREPHHGLDLLCANLTSKFEHAFGDWALGPARVRPFISPGLPEGSGCRICFGFGVFVPETNERPLGELQIADAAQREWKSLRLPAPRDSERQPAAFYAGQHGLAFGGPAHRALAYEDTGLLGGRCRYFFGNAGGALTARDSGAHRLLQDWLEDDPGAKDTLCLDEADLEPGEPMPVCRVAGHEPEFFLLWKRSADIDLPRSRAPAGPHLLLTGLVLPNCTWQTKVAEWWLDLDAQGRLALTPFRPARWALAGLPNGLLRLFDRGALQDREVLRLRRGGELARLPLPRGPLELRLLQRQHWGYLIAPRPDGFGYIALRDGDGYLLAADYKDSAFSMDHAQSRGLMSLGWLNACTGLRSRGTRVPGVKNGFPGLLDWWEQQVPGLLVKYEHRADGLALRSQTDDVLASFDRSTGAIERHPGGSKTLDVSVGASFVAGPFCFTVPRLNDPWQ